MSKNLLFSVTRKDLDISFFSGKGPGGMNRNKVKNCVRIRHRESGADSTGQNHRDRQQNIKDALHSLVEKPKFKIWWHRRVHEILEQETTEEKLDKWMKEDNLKVEIQKDGRWQPWK